MTAPDDPTTSSPDAQTSRKGQLLKGCGCVGGLTVMSLGILVIGQFDTASWASALTAFVVGVLVFALSGINGIWEK